MIVRIITHERDKKVFYAVDFIFYSFYPDILFDPRFRSDSDS